MNRIKNHLGPVVAACLFLGCKMEEEPRRIRDVINLSYLLNFSMCDDDDDGNDSPSLDDDAQAKKRLVEPKNLESACNNKPITITELAHPPPLDESYWTAKENMVSTEQHVLRMIRFDTTVCHPHRCVLIIMETLGFGTGRNHDSDGNNVDGEKQQRATNNCLLDCDRSENIIARAWRILNETPLDPQGVALHYPVIVLSCAAISLAAKGMGNEIKNDDDDGSIIFLPDFWWRALDVMTKDITMAREALQKVIR